MWRTHCLRIMMVGMLMLSGELAAAEAVKNGNYMALEYATSDAATQKKLRETLVSQLYTWRYLRVTNIVENQPAPGAFQLETIEPSSDVVIVLVVRKSVSLSRARALHTNDCVAINGRLIKFTKDAPPKMFVDPAVIKSDNERSQPKAGVAGGEDLNETDSTAN